MPPVNAARLRDRRDELDLTNGELAELVKVSQGYSENIMCGADQPSMRVIYRLSRALDLPVDQIVNGDRTPKGDPSEPPVQPAKGPKAPPRRDAPKGPKRAQSRRAA